jgi:putative membrane protein
MRKMHLTTKTTILLSTAALIAAPTVWAQYTPGTSPSTTTPANKSSNLDHKDKKFIEDAAEDGQTEVALADLGIAKAQNPQLKSFAQQMKQDHQQANTKLTQIAQNLGVQVTPSDRKESEIKRFQKLNGADFDKEFAAQQLKDHQKDIKRFEKAAQDLTNPELKQFASETLPVLERHLQHVASIAPAVGVDQSTISSALRKSGEAVGGALNDAGNTIKNPSGTGSSSGR